MIQKDKVKKTTLPLLGIARRNGYTQNSATQAIQVILKEEKISPRISNERACLKKRGSDLDIPYNYFLAKETMSKLSLLYASKRKIRFATFSGQGQVCYVRHHFDEKLSKAYAENCLKARPLFQNCEQKIKFVRGSVSQKCNIFGIINQNKKQNRTKQNKKKLTSIISETYPPPPI